MNGGDDIASLIHMQAGEPALGTGQHEAFPAGTSTASSVEQVVANTGVADKGGAPTSPSPAAAPITTPAVAAPVLTAVQQTNADTLKTIASEKKADAAPAPAMKLPALITGPTGLVVTDTGNANPSGATFPTGNTTHAHVPSVSVAPVQSQQQAMPVQNQPIAQAPAQVAPASSEEWEEMDDFSTDSQWEEEDDSTPPPAQQQPAATPAPFISGVFVAGNPQPVAAPTPQAAAPAPVQQPAAADPVAGVIALTQPTPPAAPPAQGNFKGDEELNSIVAIQKWIESQVTRAMIDSGLAILSDANNRTAGLYIHDVIYRIKWQAQTLIQQTPQDLLSMEAALTAHQVWVQGQENYWTTWHSFYGREVDRIMFIKRENYKGGTKTESENLLLAAEPQVRAMRNQFLLCQTMAGLYKNMGERFAQLEDGIKRTITFVVNEYERQKIQQKFV